jgi:hypothetical protein
MPQQHVGAPLDVGVDCMAEPRANRCALNCLAVSWTSCHCNEEVRVTRLKLAALLTRGECGQFCLRCLAEF